MSNAGYIGQGIAFAALVAGATVLELNDKPASGLWTLVVVWAILASWSKSDNNND